MFSSFPRGCGKGDELAVLWSRLGEVEFAFLFRFLLYGITSLFFFSMGFAILLFFRPC